MANPSKNGVQLAVLEESRSVALDAFTSIAPTITNLESDGYESDSGSDNNLPPTGARNANWWYSTYHNVTAIVGAGVLGLPTVLGYLGWWGGAAILASWVITLFTLWQMVQMHEMKNKKGKTVRFTTYTKLGQEAFGPKLGAWIVLPQQLAVQVGVNIVYMVTGGQSLWLFYQLLFCPSLDPVALGDGDQCCGKVGRTTFTVFFASFQLVFAQFANFDSIASLSILASFMSIGYCSIAWIDSVHLRKSDSTLTFANTTQGEAVCPLSYHFSHDGNSSSLNYIPRKTQAFGVLSALGVIGFAFGAHNVVLEIQATMPSTKQQPSKIRMWRGVMVAYIIVAICYFPVAFAGYWAFGTALVFIGNSRGNPSGGNILLQLGKPRGLIAVANLMVAIHVNGGYQLYAVPVFDLMEKFLARKFRLRYDPYDPPGSTSMMRFMIRSAYVLFTAFVACTFPFFWDLLVVFGGFALTPSTYFFIIVIGVVFAIVAIIGGVWNIKVDASTKHRFDYLNCTSPLDFPIHCTRQLVNASSRYIDSIYEFGCKVNKNISFQECRFHYLKN